VNTPLSLGRLLDRLAPPESLLLLLLSVVVGAGTGLCSVLLAKLILLVQNFSFGTLAGPLPFSVKVSTWWPPWSAACWSAR
jgi:hypothetical protein